MNYILFADHSRYNLLPFTHTRPVADVRCGIFTMRERWEHFLKAPTSSLAKNYLQAVYPLVVGTDNMLINGSIFASRALTDAILKLEQGQKLVHNGRLVAARTSLTELNADDILPHNIDEIAYEGTVYGLDNVWDIFAQNDRAIREDFALLTKGKANAAIPAGVTVSGHDIFVEEGAELYPGCIINAATGPVYIGKGAQVLEGTLMRGPVAICEGAVVKMGAKIYGATTVGPYCKVGGELNNVVLFANSNKAHDGYLGNAVIGEWCNLGADTNCSNLKNNYDEVKIWDEHSKKGIATGLTFCGLMMGDHSKCSINTMFNTGTVAGVSCNIFGTGFHEKFIPSFCWGGPEGITTYDINRAIETAGRVMARRNKQMTVAEQEMLRYVFEHTAEQRNWFAKN